MDTRVDEIADHIYRLSTFVPDIGPTGFTFNQFVIDADEPAIFHTGPRGMFPSVSEAVASVVPLERLRWITFGHLESDECGAMNLFLAAAPNAQVAHGALGCMVSINDLADRPPAPIAPDGTYDLGGKLIRNIDTPHVPHGWDAHVSTRRPPARCSAATSCRSSATAPHSRRATWSTPPRRPRTCSARRASRRHTAPTIRRLAELEPKTLAIMHGSSYNGEAAKALLALADDYERRLVKAG